MRWTAEDKVLGALVVGGVALYALHGKPAAASMKGLSEEMDGLLAGLGQMFPTYRPPAYMTPQQCVNQGGLWNSFDNSCTASNYGSGYGYGGYGYGESPQQCVGQGGLWDSFSGMCSSASQGYATGAMPNVLGQSMGTAVSMLNNAGYNAWLLSLNGIPQGYPTDYNPRRVQLVVSNNMVTATEVG